MTTETMERVDKNIMDLIQENLSNPNQAPSNPIPQPTLQPQPFPQPSSPSPIPPTTTLTSPFQTITSTSPTPPPLNMGTTTTTYVNTAQGGTVNHNLNHQIAQSQFVEGTMNQTRMLSPARTAVAGVATGRHEGHSRIQYIPFNRKVIEYKEQQKVSVVPKTRKVVEYREQKVVDMVPVEKVKQDFYAVEKITQYVPQYIPETKVTMVQRAVPYKRIEYVPVTRQVYHGAPLGNEGVQGVPFCCGQSGSVANSHQFVQGQAGGMHLSGQTGLINQFATSSNSNRNKVTFNGSSMGTGTVGMSMGTGTGMSSYQQTIWRSSSLGSIHKTNYLQEYLDHMNDRYESYIPQLR